MPAAAAAAAAGDVGGNARNAGNADDARNARNAGNAAAAAGLPPQQGFFNDDEDFFGMDDLENGGGVEEAGVEIRVALLELLGVEGPLYLMFRNSFWVLGFSALYLSCMAALPFGIGSMVCRLLQSGVVYLHTAAISTMISATITSAPSFLSSLLVGEKMVFTPIISLLRRMCQLVVNYSVGDSEWKCPDCTTVDGPMEGHAPLPLQIFDFVYISCGFCTIFAVVFFMDFLAKMVVKLKLPAIFNSIAELIGKLSTVVKVGLLLVMRIFMLPMLLGTIILLAAAVTILPYSDWQWAQFVAYYSVGALSLAWVMGITFMLTMTISVLQLREVLHPRIFGNIIRPQEPHIDLIASLVHESGFVHMRRIVVSLSVYLVLMVVLIWFPMIQLRHMWRQYYLSTFGDGGRLLEGRGAFSSDEGNGIAPYLLSFKFWYFIPEVQVPLELLVAHISFLSILDKHKDVIGRLQHKWFVAIARMLGLTRFLIPLPLVVTASMRGNGRRLRRDDHPPQQQQQQQQQQQRHHHQQPPPHRAGAAGAGDRAAAAAAAGRLRIGPPLARPPPGWDIRTPNQSTRWAWSTEEPSDVEKNLAPPAVPSHWLPRVLLLITICWLTVNAISLFLLAVPLPLGRYLLQLICVPEPLIHDPVCFLIGILVCGFGMQLMGPWLFNRRSRSRSMRLLMSLPVGALLKVLSLLLCRALGHISVGYILLHAASPIQFGKLLAQLRAANVLLPPVLTPEAPVAATAASSLLEVHNTTLSLPLMQTLHAAFGSFTRSILSGTAAATVAKVAAPAATTATTATTAATAAAATLLRDYVRQECLSFNTLWSILQCLFIGAVVCKLLIWVFTSEQVAMFLTRITETSLMDNSFDTDFSLLVEYLLDIKMLTLEVKNALDDWSRYNTGGRRDGIDGGGGDGSSSSSISRSASREAIEMLGLDAIDHALVRPFVSEVLLRGAISVTVLAYLLSCFTSSSNLAALIAAALPLNGSTATGSNDDGGGGSLSNLFAGRGAGEMIDFSSVFTFDVKLQEFLVNLQICCWTYILCWLIRLSIGPMIYLSGIFYRKVLNDNYLIGRTLVNSHSSTPQDTSGSSGTVSS